MHASCSSREVDSDKQSQGVKFSGASKTGDMGMEAFS
jgi:hypothetical protein